MTTPFGRPRPSPPTVAAVGHFLSRHRRATVGGALLALLVILAAGAPLVAGTQPTPPPPGDGSLLAAGEPDLPALLQDVLVKLLLTVALAYGSLYLYRRFVVRSPGQVRSGTVAVVETVQLGQHRALHLVRLGSQLVLLGATSTQISFLGRLHDEESAEPFEAALAAARPPSRGRPRARQDPAGQSRVSGASPARRSAGRRVAG